MASAPSTSPPATLRPAPPSPQIAPAAISSPQAPGPINVRAVRPIPLPSSQEAEVRELYYKRVRDKCAAEIKEFAHCATGRTFTIPIACRRQRFAMNDCMNSHATREEEDKAREEWFLKLPERRMEKEKEESWKEEQRQLKAEWWEVNRDKKA